MPGQCYLAFIPTYIDHVFHPNFHFTYLITVFWISHIVPDNNVTNVIPLRADFYKMKHLDFFEAGGFSAVGHQPIITLKGKNVFKGDTFLPCFKKWANPILFLFIFVLFT